MQVLRPEVSFKTAEAKLAKVVATGESILSQAEATEERKKVIQHQTSCLAMIHRPRDVLSKVECNTLREVRADDLVIVHVDKGTWQSRPSKYSYETNTMKGGITSPTPKSSNSSSSQALQVLQVPSSQVLQVLQLSSSVSPLSGLIAEAVL
ncbi:unnamed protein product [Dibothriocephalus latus]|uniref:Uncharacterized protein n=1 Tax=Dibothriocephalus latus TaxID=60516 RepID=A0A3P7LLG0_DIBLA|nr:unnamed protein product [Dibothriocephalus latus]